MKKHILILPLLIDTPILAMKLSVNQTEITFEQEVAARAEEIKREQKLAPSQKDLDQEYKNLCSKKTTPGVQFFTNKKQVKEALIKAKLFYKQKNFEPFFRILQDTNVAQAYSLEKDMKRQKKWLLKQKWDTEPPHNFSLAKTKPVFGAKQSKHSLPALLVQTLPEGSNRAEIWELDVQERLEKIKNLKELTDLSAQQYRLATFIFLNLDTDTPGGDFTYRKLDAIENIQVTKKHIRKHGAKRAEKLRLGYVEWMQTLFSLLHMLNYTNVVREKPGEKKRQLAKSIIGIHQFITDLSVHPKGPDWTPEKNIEFVENFANDNVEIKQACQELKINFTRLYGLLWLLPKKLRLSKEKKILIAKIVGKQASFYEKKPEQTDKYIPSLYYPDDLDAEIIEFNKEDLSYLQGAKEKDKFAFDPYLNTSLRLNPQFTLNPEYSHQILSSRNGLWLSVQKFNEQAFEQT